ncbi:hypothetical protein HDV06_000835 [Boothiomyces sp. JEL0866]|nr:hypothetical protein HDV06_000835 [Boothiomyces sp. JEL0866]
MFPTRNNFEYLVYKNIGKISSFTLRVEFKSTILELKAAKTANPRFVFDLQQGQFSLCLKFDDKEISHFIDLGQLKERREDCKEQLVFCFNQKLYVLGEVEQDVAVGSGTIGKGSSQGKAARSFTLDQLNKIIEKRKILDSLEQEIEENLHFRKQDLANKKKTLLERKQQLSKMVASLAKQRQVVSSSQIGLELTKIYKRQSQLIKELDYIYPLANDCVRSIHLSKGTKEGIAMGLGYLAHLVVMISVYLNIPLRYPITIKSSRSSIHDPISLFPVSEYFSLIQDIEQLLNLVGLRVTDLRKGVLNLQVLIRFLGQEIKENIDSPLNWNFIGIPYKGGEGTEISSALSVHIPKWDQASALYSNMEYTPSAFVFYEYDVVLCPSNMEISLCCTKLLDDLNEAIDGDDRSEKELNWDINSVSGYTKGDSFTVASVLIVENEFIDLSDVIVLSDGACVIVEDVEQSEAIEDNDSDEIERIVQWRVINWFK